MALAHFMKVLRGTLICATILQILLPGVQGVTCFDCLPLTGTSCEEPQRGYTSTCTTRDGYCVKFLVFGMAARTCIPMCVASLVDIHPDSHTSISCCRRRNLCNGAPRVAASSLVLGAAGVALLAALRGVID